MKLLSLLVEKLLLSQERPLITESEMREQTESALAYEHLVSIITANLHLGYDKPLYYATILPTPHY